MSGKKKLTTSEFEEWHEEHLNNAECQANHTGPSGNMEVAAVIAMFSRSEKKYSAKTILETATPRLTEI